MFGQGIPGRASDLAVVQKCNLSLSSGNVLFLRLIRAKTPEEQGLSLFPDKSSLIMCPLRAIAKAIQAFPVPSVLDLEQFSDVDDTDATTARDATQLMDVLLHCGDGVDAKHGNRDAFSTSQHRTSTPLKMQGYVNRVLKVASARQAKAGISDGISFHSFRRGGAQHANADVSLSPQWIFDRGSWNMTATNKVVAYVFNTTSDDRKVSKVLSDWKSDENPSIPSLAGFDSSTRSRICKLGRALFASSTNLADRTLNLNQQVADLLVASLIQHFPAINDRYPMGPYTSRRRMCLFSLEAEMPELLAWSVELNRKASVKCTEDGKPFTREIQLINQQNAVIAQLIDANKAVTARVTELERQKASVGQSATAIVSSERDVPTPAPV